MQQLSQLLQMQLKLNLVNNELRENIKRSLFSTICQAYQRFLEEIIIGSYLIQPVEKLFLKKKKKKVHN